MLVLTADQRVRLTASYTDRYGNPAPIDGMPRWESSVDGVVMITPAADGMSADVVTVGPVGAVQVRATADAIPGAEERSIIGILDIEVVGGEARVVTLTAGAAESKDLVENEPMANASSTPEQAQQAADQTQQPDPNAQIDPNTGQPIASPIAQPDAQSAGQPAGPVSQPAEQPATQPDGTPVPPAPAQPQPAAAPAPQPAPDPSQQQPAQNPGVAVPDLQGQGG